MNKKCEINLDHLNIDKGAKDLLLKLLEKDTFKRISAKDALEHYYINEGTDTNSYFKTSEASEGKELLLLQTKEGNIILFDNYQIYIRIIH